MRGFASLLFLAASFHLAESSDLEMANVTEFLHKEAKAVAESQNKFTKDLYIALSNGKDGNLFFSPFSISAALAMVFIGSKGRTESQIQSVMHLSLDKLSLRKAFHDLVTDFKEETPEYELKTSNMVYISNRPMFSVLDEFLSVLTNDFLSSSKLVDFNDSESVCKDINSAVEKETNSKIKDLIAPGLLNKLTRMVLVNAIYFKGLWLHQFDSSRTQPMPFWVTADKSVNVPMMTIEEEFRMAHKVELDATLLALDYKGGRLSMVILLPNKRDGLSDLEEKLAAVDFGMLDTETATTKINVFLPKFKIEETIDLVPVLELMGMTDLFSEETSDLSGISEQDLFVSNMIHKAFLEVNEEGSEAAAATGVFVRMRRSLEEPKIFLADRPFMLFIYDKVSHLSLFAGRLSVPPVWRTSLKDEL